MVRRKGEYGFLLQSNPLPAIHQPDAYIGKKLPVVPSHNQFPLRLQTLDGGAQEGAVRSG